MSMTVDALHALSQALLSRRERHLIRHHRLTGPQFELLREVWQAEGTEPMTLGEIAELIRCSRGNLTSVADHLERDGWVMRERSRDDRRVVRIVILADRAAQVACIIAEVDALEAEWAEQLRPIEATLYNMTAHLIQTAS